ncbi:hypothetical protein G1O98_00840 [Nostoc sp. UIC10630]|nr:hypothetical protein [Nostoc sp. UIC 10630]
MQKALLQEVESMGSENRAQIAIATCYKKKVDEPIKYSLRESRFGSSQSQEIPLP